MMRCSLLRVLPLLAFLPLLPACTVGLSVGQIYPEDGDAGMTYSLGQRASPIADHGDWGFEGRLQYLDVPVSEDESLSGFTYNVTLMRTLARPVYLLAGAGYGYPLDISWNWEVGAGLEYELSEQGDSYMALFAEGGWGQTKPTDTDDGVSRDAFSHPFLRAGISIETRLYPK